MDIIISNYVTITRTRVRAYYVYMICVHTKVGYVIRRKRDARVLYVMLTAAFI